MSIFASTSISSVYSIYSMIVGYIITILSNVFSSTNYIIGQAYVDNIEKLKKYYDAMNSVFMILITSLLSVCILLLLPFIKIYTSGINDVDYINILYPILFCSIQFISWTYRIPGQLLGVSGNAKIMSKISIIEAIINLIISLILVKPLGILGVLIGTLASCLIRPVGFNYIAEYKILNRRPYRTLFLYCVNTIIMVVTIIFYFLFPIHITNYGIFIVYGIIFSCIYFIISFFINLLLNHELILFLKRFIIRKKSRR